MRLLCIGLFVLLLAGCEQTGRYQLVANGAGGTAWRIDTKTGEVSACGFYSSGKLSCVAAGK